jgi:hypothetical protein
MNCGLWDQVPSGLLNLSPGGTFTVSPQFIRGWDNSAVINFNVKFGIAIGEDITSQSTAENP